MEEHAPPDGKRHFFDEPRNTKRLVYAVYALCAVVIALDLVVHRHASFSAGVFDAEMLFG